MVNRYWLNTFQHSQKESESLDEWIGLRSSLGGEWVKSWVDLDSKKEKSFKDGQHTKWEIDYRELDLSGPEVAKDKKLAKTLMFPSLTQPVLSMGRVFGHLNSQMVDLGGLIGSRKAKRYVRAMSEMCNEQITHCAEVDIGNY